MTESIKKNLSHIQKRIHKACVKSGRNPNEVSLLPVSKSQSQESICMAHECGFNRFGENKVQEISEKSQKLSDLNINWCMIGHLQTNKVNSLLKCVSELHSLDNLKLALALEEALQKQGRFLDVLLQVNTSGEEQKFGLSPQELMPFVKELKSFSCLRVKGLMTLALFSKEESQVRRCFVDLRKLSEKLKQEGPENMSWNRLSMGMSYDLEWAIEEGSTEVRVGQGVFGPRRGLGLHGP